MARTNTPENQGGNDAIDGMMSVSGKKGGKTGLNVDREGFRAISEGLRGITNEAKNAAREVGNLVKTMGSLGGGGAGRLFGSLGGGSRTNVPVAGSSGSPASMASAARGASGALGATGSAGGGGGGAGGGGGGILSSTINLGRTIAQPMSDLNNYMNQRIAQGADYSLQADRMSVQLQQMYGMSNSQVRNQLRMPLTNHYLLGGGTAINDLLQMQANTGLTASKQASSVESIRAISGFSYGTQDVTKMLSSMASPDVANRMFMMGGTGMYGIGGKERTGMQTIQDIVRRTGLTNPEALKGALQQGSNTRQRLSAMGVPQDMQDMVIQYAMQNSEYQKKTGGGAMYDPSMEENRKTMGIEGSYAVQHEKTTGERIKREERFYGRQVDNFAQFEKNLRLSTSMLAAFEDRLSKIVGIKISSKGHPVTNVLNYAGNYASNIAQASAQVVDEGASLIRGGDPVDNIRTGDPVVGSSGSPVPSSSGKKLRPADESKLAKLDPRLSSLLRPMLEENPAISIGGGTRSHATQNAEFRARYRPTNRTEKQNETDREWNGVIWEMKPEAVKAGKAAMAPPGQSMHEIGLAADLHGDDNWVKNNAARFGLVTGATGRGGPGDEPFHVEPKTTSNLPGGSGYTKKSGSSGGTVSAASATGRRASANTVRTRASGSGGSSTGMYSPNAGAIAAMLTQQSNEKYSQLSSGPVTSRAAHGGDPIDGMTGSAGGGGGMSITISPNIYMSGGQDMAGDMRRIAKEIGSLIENEVKLKLMRSS